MATPKPTVEQQRKRIETIEECLREGFSPFRVMGPKGSAVEEAGRRLGLPSGLLSSAIRRKQISPDWTQYSEPTREPLPSVPPREKREETVALRDENSALRARLREIDRDNIEASEVREKIMGLAAYTPEPPNWIIKEARSSSGVTGVPSMIWSDWHIGENVSKAEVNGINEFNLSIAETRIRLLVERTIDLCMNHMTSPRYPGIVINLLGDIVSGGIHPDLAETDEDEIFPIIIWTVDRLIWAFTKLADRFGRVFVPVAPGNHGRIFDKKPRAKRYVYRNADWLIGNLVERHFKAVKDKRLSFMIPSSGECLYRVYNHRYLAVHGDDLGVKGGDGLIGMLGPVARGEIKVRHSSAQIGRDYETLLLGHWHQQLWLPRVIVNNCLVGYNEYARRMLRAVPTPPSQAIWFTHPKRGITARWEVVLTDDPHITEQEWVSIGSTAA